MLDLLSRRCVEPQHVLCDMARRRHNDFTNEDQRTLAVLHGLICNSFSCAPGRAPLQRGELGDHRRPCMDHEPLSHQTANTSTDTTLTFSRQETRHYQKRKRGKHVTERLSTRCSKRWPRCMRNVRCSPVKKIDKQNNGPETGRLRLIATIKKINEQQKQRVKNRQGLEKQIGQETTNNK